MKVPDVNGLQLREAREKLEKASIKIGSVRLTSEPRNRYDSYDDTSRVARIRQTGVDTVELIVLKPL